MKVPVAAKPRTGRVGIEGCRDLIPGDEPVFGRACGIVGVADALELADSDELVENPAGVALYHGIGDAVSREARLNVVEVTPWSGSDGGLGHPPHKRPITNNSLHRTTLGQPFDRRSAAEIVSVKTARVKPPRQGSGAESIYWIRSCLWRDLSSIPRKLPPTQG